MSLIFLNNYDKKVKFQKFNRFFAAFVALFPLIGSIMFFNYIDFMAYLGCAAFVYSPQLIERFFNIVVLEELRFLTVFQVMLHAIFGKFFHFYDKFPLYDSILHVTGGILLAFLGLSTFYGLEKRFSNYTPRAFKTKVSIASFNLVNSLGVIWEIIEFTADQIFGGTPGYRLAQEGSLFDTMTDLIENNMGALLAILIFWRVIELKKEKELPVDKTMKDLIKI